MTEIEENGQRPALWDFAKYTEIYISPMILPALTDEEIGREVRRALKMGPAVVIKGDPK